MRLNHVNLCAGDVPALADLFVRHFGFIVLQSGTMPEAAGTATAGSPFAMLRDRHGFSLVITTIDAGAVYPRSFHVGVALDAADDVRAKHAELSAAGLAPKPISAFEALGASWTAFYCPVGDGLEIEVNWCSRAIVDLVAVP